MLTSSIQQLSKYIMPVGCKEDSREYYKVYIFTITSVVTILIAFSMSGVFYVVNATKLATALLVAGSFGVFLAPFFKKFGNLNFFANLYNFSFFIVLTFNIWKSHGLYSPGLAWLMFIPLYSLCFSNRFSVIFWSIVIVAEILMWGYLDYLGIKFLPEYSVNARTVLTVFFPICLLLFLFVLAKIYSYTTTESINYLHNHKDELNSNIKILTNEKENFEKLAITDSLTGIYNRYFFDFRTVNEYKRIIRGNETIVVAMLDIDFFKKLNDQFGHGFGDKCLKIFAQMVSQFFCRPNDLFARYGGEEFVVVLSNITKKEAQIHLEEVRKAIEELVLEKNGQQVKMTVTIGASTGSPKYSHMFKDILKQADDALYKAKQNGRNRVELVEFT